MRVCKRVQYSGRVQGVGFRYTAQRLADSFSIAGYVRNLSDGDVELVAEGSNEQVQAYLDALAARMAGHIQHTGVSDEPPTGFKRFDIRY